MTALLADIGGTNARFGVLYDGAAEPSHIKALAVTDHPSAADAARAYLATLPDGPRPTRAVIAAAGPVVDGRVVMTNAAWTVDAARLHDALGMERVSVLNDFEALAWGLPDLDGAGVVRLGAGVADPDAPIVVMGPGTGFGLAALIGAGESETVLVTEGGHATLPAESRREDAIISVLRDRLFHVSIERVLSGPGLEHLYQSIAMVDQLTVPPRTSAEIIQHALAGDEPTCLRTLEMFCGFLGSIAGNVALTFGAKRGVLIGGGVTPRFTDFLIGSSFREQFEAKGRLSAYLSAIPTGVIVHPNPTFVGLARWEQRH
jgi:glucokinase